MDVVQDYRQSALVPRLRSLGLSKRQWEIVADDVTQRLESVLSHWHDESFRRTILVLGTEEASFWEPRNASLEIRSLVVVAVRNSLIEDLGASRPYFKVLQSRKPLVPDDRMPWITTDAVKFFEVADLDSLQIKPAHDVFGDLPRRFPNAWHALSLLSPTYLARRNPLLRPIHYNSELEAQLANSEGLNERHKRALASLISSD